MQHLQNQSSPIHIRKWNFDQSWNNAQHALLQQNEQRSDDVTIAKQNIETRIKQMTQLQNNKVSVMNDNLRFLKSDGNSLERQTESTIQHEKQYEDEYQNRCIDFTSDYLRNAQTFAQKILSYSQGRCNQVQKKLNAVDQNIRNKTENQMKQLRTSSIEHIKSIITNESANQKNALDNLSSLVTNSLKNMRDTLKQYQKQSIKTQSNLQNQILTLDKEMFTLVQKQNQQGDITYDCLLKLVEDSYGKIQQIRMR